MLCIDIQICIVLTLVVGRRGEWLGHLDHRQACVRPVPPSIPRFSADERGWVDIWVILHPSPTFLVWVDVFRDPMQWPLRQLPWHAPSWVGRWRWWKRLCACKYIAFWDEVV